MHERITIHVAPSDRAEAELVVRTIEELMGGHDLFTLDAGRFSLFTVSSRSNQVGSFDAASSISGITSSTSSTSSTGSTGGATDSATGSSTTGSGTSAGNADVERASNSAPATALGFGDFAVLYRTDAQSAVLREAFGRSGIPFGKHSHELLADRPVVRALLDVWRDTCENAADDVSAIDDGDGRQERPPPRARVRARPQPSSRRQRPEDPARREQDWQGWQS